MRDSEPMLPDSTLNTQQTAKRGSAWPVVIVALLLTTICGGGLRFMSLNWDDFASLHPDERFLTRNLLPLVGGGLEFTPYPDDYPPHTLLVRTNTALQSQFELQTNTNLRVGALQGQLGADLAGYYLETSARVNTYPDVVAAANALAMGEVEALFLKQSDAQLQLAANTNFFSFAQLSSEDVQRIRCRALNPATNGAGGYFDTDCSPLNPHNAAVGVYAYGTLPLFMAHFGSEILQQLDAAGQLAFQGETLVWRALSALFDTLTIIVVFFIGTRMHNKWVGLFAAILYAAAPLAIQKAHFGTVNSITAFFVALAMWAAVCVQDRGRYFHFAVFGIALGAALAGRINVIPLAGVVVLAAMVYAAPVWDRRLPYSMREALFWRAVVGVFLAGFATVLSFRLFNPYAFDGPSFLGIIPNLRWLADAQSSSFNVSGASDIPPNWQWLARPGYIYPLKDMLLWGMGIAMGVLAWFGFLWSGYRLLRGKIGSMRNILIFAWVGIYFAWIGGLWVMTMRYYLPLYSSLAVFAGWGIYALWREAQDRRDDLPITRALMTALGGFFALIPLYYITSATPFTPTVSAAAVFAVLLIGAAFVPGLQRRRAGVLGAFALAFTVIWGLMFTNIYQHQSNRVQASRYVWENVSGDFSMRIEGAPQGTPLVNIALANGNPNSAEKPADLEAYATRYTAGAPQFSAFTAPATGTIRSIHAPHLGDPNDDPTSEQLYISISQTDANGVPQLLGEVIFEQDLSRESHILGDRYDITLPEPISVEAGQRYMMKVEALEAGGAIIGAGEVMLTEGTWDDRITTTMVCNLPDGITLADDPAPGLATFDSCNGLISSYALVQSYDLPMSYPVDEALKRDAILDGLEVGDYLAITSNRFYDTETRNPARWPMTTAYYRALFAGELGYELVETFSESFELGPFSVNSEYLPIYDSPSWLNEFEADEAFHVYDHATVFLFRKTDAYDHASVRAQLETVSLTRSDQLFGSPSQIGDDIANVVYWSSLEANDAPTALMQPEDVREANQAGGTWSDRFDSDSLLNTNQAVGVALWWLLIIGLGLIVWPLLFTVFRQMADRGYGFAKIVALIVIGWLAWMLTTLKLPLWSQGGLLLITLLLACFSLIVAARNRVEMTAYLREQWRRFVGIEVITGVLFLFFIGVRLTNPDMWHYPMGGERPMDFAYFNATLRTTLFPAYDPWYSGGFINYYYVGYVLVGVPTLLLKIVPAFAYNLIIPTLFAMTGIGAFSVAFNIVDRWRINRVRRVNSEKINVPVRVGNPWIAGVAALLLCCVLGNLDTIRVLGHGIAQTAGYTRPTGLNDYLVEQYQAQNGFEPDFNVRLELHERAEANYITDRIAYEVDNFLDLSGSLVAGLGRVLSGQPMLIGYNRWYWAPTRIVQETPDLAGTQGIVEMPYFTFVYGDLHAHMINMPVMLFAMLFIFNEVAVARRDRRKPLALALALVLGGVSIGLMRAVNTWDWPTFMVLGVVGLGYAWWLRWQAINRASILYMLATIGGFVTIAMIAALPYSSYYASVYDSILLWDGGKTPLWAFFDVHGLFLFLITSLFVWETARWMRSTKVSALRGQRDVFVIALGIAALTGFAALIAALIDYQAALVVLPLILWIIPLFFREGQSEPMQFVLVLIGLALALMLAVEVIVLGGDIGRQNTQFKFYVQVWLLLSVAGGAAFAWVVQRSHEWSMRLTVVWFVPLTLMVAIAAAFPLMATRARAVDRLAPQTPLTLNGHDYMQYAELGLFDTLVSIPLKNDYAIIRWLQENVQGTPVIMEWRSVGASEYHYNGRIAINTGLPSVLGWNFHQRQQRTLDPLPILVQQRENNVRYFYETAKIGDAINILRHYDVSYVIVSDMERAPLFSQVTGLEGYRAGLEKFEQMLQLGLLRVAYEQNDARIYEVNQFALDAFVRDAFALAPLLNLSVDGGLTATANTPQNEITTDEVLRQLSEDAIPAFEVEDISQLSIGSPRATDILAQLESDGFIAAQFINGDNVIYSVNLQGIAAYLNGED